MTPLNEQKVIVIAADLRVGQLVARHVRSLRVYCELTTPPVTAAKLEQMQPQAIIVLDHSQDPTGQELWSRELLELGIPVLGVGCGMVGIARALGGTTALLPSAERDGVQLRQLKASPLGNFSADVTGGRAVSYGCESTVHDVPGGFSVFIETDTGRPFVIGDVERSLYGVSLVPEQLQTDFGNKLLHNFLYDVVGCRGTWTPEVFIENTVRSLRERLGDGLAICGLSGGVDSAVAAALVHRAIGDRLIPVFVDHGLLRKNEKEEVVDAFRRLNMPLVVVDAADRFLSVLQGVTDPEQKRKRIGAEFIKVFEEEAAKVAEQRGRIDFLVQGTVYSDVIESGAATGALVKSHHNVGGLPEHMQLKLVEPLRDIFKDEGREIGEALGLPESIVWRQPFPGPGLAIRVIGEVTPERLAILREADFIARDEIARAGYARNIWQYFVVLTPLRSVGVKDGSRTYGYTAVLRAVTSSDGMTADWAEIPYEVLRSISARMTAEVPQINRLVYDITAKPPGTIEWE